MATKISKFSSSQKLGFFALIICCQLHFFPVINAATEYSRYLTHIFQKYGSGDTITFEGLEHLMYNLGLGGIEFDPQHTIDEHHIVRPVLKASTIPSTSTIQTTTTTTTSITADNDYKTKLANIDDQSINELLPKLPWENNDDSIDNKDILLKNRNLAKKSIILEFREMHDPRHRHPREKVANFDAPPPQLSENVCLSPQEVLRLVVNHDDLHKRKLYETVKQTPGDNTKYEHNTEEEYIDFINNVHLTPSAFMKLCPALLTQIDQHVCARPAPLKQTDDSKEALWNAWIYASASIFILSACGLLGIALVPLMQTVAYQEILKFLVAVAVGTLSGDALMHLIPHALVNEHDDETAVSKPTNTSGHSHDNTPVWICACAFMTAVLMYILEHLLPLLRGQNAGGHGHSHSHGHTHHDKNTEHQHNPNHIHHHDGHKKTIEKPTIEDSKSATISINNDAIDRSTADLKEFKELNVMLNETKLDMKSPNSKPLTPVAFMVIIGDGLHNLTDGLAIGAAFASDPVTGLATAFAVLCHELPHELGDFALLLQTGVSIKRAMVLNIVSSILSFLGMAIGLLIAGLHSNMTQWIYAGTAGSFLYIAFADLIPAMNEDGKRDIKSVLIQIAGILVGGIIMIIIAVNEEHLEELFQ